MSMWLKLHSNVGTCPVCGEDLTHNFDERDGGRYYDIYTCYECEIGVTYISPDDGREYHDYNNGEIEIQFEAGI